VPEHERIEAVSGRMRRDWNDRAREDANFYVAFGRRGQGAEEFFATAKDVVVGLERELKRMPRNANRRAWRALEIGCGPGRLMLPMSRHFGEIHGVDVSDEMISRARENLAGIPHAHVHHTSGADLAPFSDESFDFVYSYAVFQHIPSREVVMQYLAEAQRVLKVGGFLRAQINGLDETARRYDTWEGVRIPAADIAAFARENGLQLLALEGARTQYMWTTMRKRTPGWDSSVPSGRMEIRRITNAHTSEPVAPSAGRFASIAVWAGRVPPNCDLNSLEVQVGGLTAVPAYIGPSEPDGIQQINVTLPQGVRTGWVPLEFRWRGVTLCDTPHVRIVPAPPWVPGVVSVSDGIDLLSGARIVTGVIKVTIEEARSLEGFQARVAGVPVADCDVFCTDPLPPKYEINFDVPAGVEVGLHMLEMRLGRRLLGQVPIEIVKRSP
jgi:SAM-dependent methyltransferase